MKQISRNYLWFTLNFPLWFFFASVWLHSNTVSSVLALAGNDSLACLPKPLLGSATWCSCVLDVFPSSHTQKVAGQCLSKHTVPISARFHHLAQTLANLSSIGIINLNSYIWPIGTSFQDQKLSPSLKVLQHKVIWDPQVENTKIIAFLICHICHITLHCSQQPTNFCHSQLSEDTNNSNSLSSTSNFYHSTQLVFPIWPFPWATCKEFWSLY